MLSRSPSSLLFFFGIGFGPAALTGSTDFHSRWSCRKRSWFHQEWDLCSYAHLVYLVINAIKSSIFYISTCFSWLNKATSDVRTSCHINFDHIKDFGHLMTTVRIKKSNIFIAFSGFTLQFNFLQWFAWSVLDKDVCKRPSMSSTVWILCIFFWIRVWAASLQHLYYILHYISYIFVLIRN